MTPTQPRKALSRLGVVVMLCLASELAESHPELTGTIAAANRRLESDPSGANYLTRAELHRIAGRYAEAEHDLEHAAALGGEQPELWLCRAALALDRGRDQEALHALAVHRAARPEDARGWLLEGRLAKRAGRLRDAAAALERAADLQASPNPDLYMERSRLLRLAGEPEAALAALDQGIEKLGRATSLELAAVDAEALSNPAAALARLDRLGSRTENPSALLGRRAALLRLAGEFEQARWLEAASDVALVDRSAAPAVVTTAFPAVHQLAGHPASEWLSTTAVSRVTGATAVVSRGPYLSMAGPNRITIRWRTDVASDSRVRYGTSLGFLTSSADDPTVTTEHQVTLTGLAPLTRYYYSVGSIAGPLAGGDSNHSFVTSPVPGDTGPRRLWVIGDSGTANSIAAAVRNAFDDYVDGTNRAADLWLMLGDNAYGVGTDAEYQAAVFDMYPAMLRTTPLWPTRGNHDFIHSGANNDYYDIFSLPAGAECGGLPSGTEAYYSFDHGNIHFVCLDSEGSNRSKGGAMAVWLRADLAASPRPWVIAYWHHPPYTKGSHDSDNEFDSEARMGEMRRNIVPILDSAGVDLTLTGHSHSYERSFLINGHYGISSTLNLSMIVDAGDGRWDGDGSYYKPTAGSGPLEGVIHTVAGASGHTGGGPLNHPVMVASLDVAGSMVIDVAGNRLDARYLDSQGAIRDSFTIVKGTPPPVHVGPTQSGLSLELLGTHPTRGPVRFAYQLPVQTHARLVVLDSTGRPVRSVRSGLQVAGRHEAVWDGRDERGRECPAGVYFAVLDVGGKVAARKVVRLGS